MLQLYPHVYVHTYGHPIFTDTRTRTHTHTYTHLLFINTHIHLHLHKQKHTIAKRLVHVPIQQTLFLTYFVLCIIVYSDRLHFTHELCDTLYIYICIYMYIYSNIYIYPCSSHIHVRSKPSENRATKGIAGGIIFLGPSRGFGVN